MACTWPVKILPDSDTLPRLELFTVPLEVAVPGLHQAEAQGEG